MPATLPSTPSRWRPKPRSLILAAILILCVGGFTRFAYLRITLRPTPRPEYWEAKLAELDPPPPGAISPEEGSKVLTSRPFESDPVVTAVPKFEISDVLVGEWDVNRQDIAAVVKVFELRAFLDARDELQRALQIGWKDRVSLDLNNVTFPSYVDYRVWAKWLVAHSRWSYVQGDIDATVEDWVTVFQLSRQVRRLQTLIAQFVENAINSLVAHAIIIACQENPKTFDVARLAEQVDKILGKPVYAGDILRGEDIYEQNMLEYFFVREGGNWIDVSTLVTIRYNTGYATLLGTQIAPPSRIWNLASPLFHDLETASRHINDHYSVYDSCANIADYHKIEQRIERNAGSGQLSALDGWVMYLPGDWSFTRAPLLYYHSQCFIEAALASLAIQEYRRQKGHLPESLSDLVPEFLPRIPIDYADGRPLRYRRTQDGYLLYSIGEDGRDDGGRCDDKNPADFNRGPDVVFSKLKRGELGK